MGSAEVVSHRILLCRSECEQGPCRVMMPPSLFPYNLSHRWVPQNEHWMLHLPCLMPPPTLSPGSGLSGWTCLVRLPDLPYETEGYLFTFDIFCISGWYLHGTVVHPYLMRNSLILKRRGKREKERGSFQHGKGHWYPGRLCSGPRAGKTYGCCCCWLTGLGSPCSKEWSHLGDCIWG